MSRTRTPRSIHEIANSTLRVAISLGIPGLSELDASGAASGLDVDFARAVTIALTGTTEHITWLPTVPKDRITAITTGIADLGACNTSWTAARDNEVMFVGVLCHDGEGFLTATDTQNLHDLDGTTASIQAGSTSPGNLLRLADDRGIHLTPLPADTPEEALRNYLDGTTSCYVLDQSALAGIRAGLSHPERHHVLTDTISYEPMAPFVAPDNLDLFRICRHVLFTLINAEVAQLAGTDSLDRLRAQTATTASDWQLHPGWLDIVLDKIGHYGDMYATNLGDRSALHLPRAPLNHPCSTGGAHFAAP